MIASSVGMDKIVFKQVLRGLNISCVDSFDLLKSDYYDQNEVVIERIEEFGYPIIIKPSRQGSSIGINICRSKEDLIKSLENSFLYDERLLIEKFVDIKKEVNIAVFKHKEEYVCSQTEEPVYDSDILGFDQKYQKNSDGFESIKRVSPANISEAQNDYIKEIAIKVYKTLDMYGVVRFDFIIDKEDNIFLNEVNTIPGSMANYLYKNQFTYKKLIDNIVLNAFIRKDRQDEFLKSFSSDVLNSGFDGFKK
jgi:D-alanine-D-alanine ligase